MLRKKASSIGFALTGIKIALKEEHNFQSHIFIAAGAVVMGAIFEISESEWLAVIGMIGLVLTAELLNTTLEELCDMLRETHDPHIAKIKDLAAGAVFLASLAALAVGIAIFLPKLLAL